LKTKAELLAELTQMEIELEDMHDQMSDDPYSKYLIGIANQRDATYQEMAEQDFADLFFFEKKIERSQVLDDFLNG